MRDGPSDPPAPASDSESSWRDTARYLTYTGLAYAMGHAPERVAYGIADVVSRFMARGPRLEMNQRHMRRVLASECPDGIEPDPALVRRWSKRTFSEYSRYWADGARLSYLGGARVLAKWRMEEGLEHLQTAMADGKGAIVALPHVGSWEWGGYFLALEGWPMTAVVERLEPPQLFDWFVAQRATMGLTAVPLGQGSMAALIRALRENHLAGLVADRDMAGNGVEVEFFGEKTTLPGGAATLAFRTGAPLIPVVVYSGPGTWHTGVIRPPIDTTRRGTLREDVARVTQELATVFEDDIRRRPEQWHMYQPNWPSDPR